MTENDLWEIFEATKPNRDDYFIVGSANSDNEVQHGWPSLDLSKRYHCIANDLLHEFWLVDVQTKTVTRIPEYSQ